MLSFLDKIPFGTPKIRRIAFWLFTALVCYTIIGFFIVPPIIKSVAQSQLTANLKRTSTIEKVYFNPFTLRLEITNLKVEKKNGKGEMVSVGLLTAAPGPSTIWEFAPVISYLTIADLTVDVTFFGGGVYSFSDLMGASDTPEKEAPKDDNAAVFPFALYGFELTNATIIFDDKPHNKRHVISEMNLRVPFTSSIEDKQKEFTQPKFTAVVNGDPIELKGRTLPFDKTLLTEFQLGAVDIDLDQYWKYVPVKTSLELDKGRFTSNISLNFERPDAQRMKLFLGGGGKLKDLELVDPMEGTVFSLKELDFEMERFSLGDQALILTSVTLDTPYFRVIRSKDNTINWATYFPANKEKKAAPETKATQQSAFVVDVKKSVIKNGELLWNDRALPGGFQRILKDFNFEGSDLTTEEGKSSQFSMSIGSEGVFGARGSVSMDPMIANVTLSAEHVPMHAYEPYIAQFQPLLIDSGLADLSAVVDFKMVDNTPEVNVTEGKITLSDFAARKPEAKDPSLAFKTFAISNAAVMLKEKNVTVDEIRLSGPMARVVREKDGQFDLQRLLMAQDSPKQDTEAVAEAAPEAAPEVAQATEEPAAENKASDNWSGEWSAAVKQVVIEAGDFSMRDNALKIPGSVGVKNFKLTVKDMTTRKGATLSYDLGGVWSGRGSFGLGGTLSVEPLWTKGRLRLNGLGLKPLDNYIAEQADAIIGKGVAYANLQYSFKGGGKPQFSVSGDTAIHSLAIKDTHTDEEIVSFDKFTVSSLSLDNEPYRLKIGEVALEKPHAVVEMLENGQLNFQRVMRMEPPAAPPTDGEEVAEAKKEAVEEGPAQPTVNAEALPKPEVEQPFFDTLEVDKVSITNGAVEYRDNTVHPAFATSLDDMNMSLTGINQTPEAKPQIDFKGNIQGTPLSVTGALNPAVTPLYSDLKISVNGMGLIPVTPYTLEYLAYPIQKGRLYADVNFKTEDWVLSADNKFFIEQLKLGKKDTRPDAPDVPVQFGLSLLQDSDGNMQINLPIRGRLDDPDFKIGGIVFKAIVSLLFKALSSPFTLIGSMFGGGEDMDFVVFEPGRSNLDQSGTEKLDTVVKALSERDRLSLEVDGVIAPTTDTTGLIQVKFERKVKQMKYESLSRDEQAAISVEAVTFDSSEEYEDWLYEAYADEPDEEGIKPTTLFITDRQPPEVMEKFIRERIVITEDDLHELAMERAQTVRDYIVVANPELGERVFILDKEDAEGKTGVPAHRADLGLE